MVSLHDKKQAPKRQATQWLQISMLMAEISYWESLEESDAKAFGKGVACLTAY
jgi:hypothetical protein